MKEPILRKIQFSQISRLDGLVDEVYNGLKNEFYPGETAIARVRDQRIKVIIREKAKFNSITMANGEVRPAYSRCRVELASTPGQEIAVDESLLIRDRKKFTKVILRTFIKYAVSRESWAGAPWIVKDDYAKMYRIDQQVPLHLQKLALEHKKAAEPKPKRNKEEEALKRAQEKAEKKALALEKKQARAASVAAAKLATKAALKLEEKTKFSQFSLEIKTGDQSSNQASVEPAPKKIVKEDLDWPYEEDEMRKPPLKSFDLIPKEDRTLVGRFLEIWSFLNIYHEALLLSQFSFDDFVSVLTCEDSDCSLLDEIHCSILSVFVGTSSTDLQIDLPAEESDLKNVSGVSDENDEEPENNEESEENMKDDEKPTAITSAKDDEGGEEDGEEEEDDDQEEDEDEIKEDEGDGSENSEDDETSEDDRTNRGDQYETFQNQDWTERLRKRMYKDGGWQQIIIGFLSHVSYVPEWQSDIKEILDEMASLKHPLSLGSAYQGYFRLNFVEKVKILSIMVSLLEGSDLVRNFIDKCLDEQTKVRREKTDAQRHIKTFAEAVKLLDEEKKQYYSVALATDLADKMKIPKDPETGHKVPRSRKEEFDLALAEENEDFSKLMKAQRIELDKIKDLNEKIKHHDSQLAHLEVQRIKCLGKDRFYNQYWWFEIERPKLPEEEKRESRKDKKTTQDSDALNNDDEEMAEVNESASEAGVSGAEEHEEELDAPAYAMGRLWVQGPTEEDARVGLAEPDNVKIEDIDVANMQELSLSERQKLEEGEGHLVDHDDWKFYDTVEDIDKLMASLNRYGNRESRLLRELEATKRWIEVSMKAKHEVAEIDEKRRKQEAQEIVDEEEEKGEFNNGDDGDDDGDDDEEDYNSEAQKEDEDMEDDDGGKSEEEEDEVVTVGRRRKRPPTRERRTRSNTKQRKSDTGAVKSSRRAEFRKMERLAELEKELQKQLPSRIQEWTNEEAVEHFGHSHYESYRKTRGRGRKR